MAEETVNQRLYKFIKQYCGYVRTLAEALNMNETTLSNKIRGDRKLDLGLIIEILVKYEELSPDWLLLGKGSMLRDKKSIPAVPQNEASPNDDKVYVGILEKQLAEEKQRNKDYWNMIQQLIKNERKG